MISRFWSSTSDPSPAWAIWGTSPGKRAVRIRIVDANGDRIETIPARNQYAEEALAMEALVRDGTPSLTPGTDAALTQAVIAAWKAG